MLTSHYGTLLAIHCDLRWLVLIAGAGAVAVAAFGMINRASFAPLGRVAGLIYVSFLDTQVLLGILLWFSSPYVHAFLMNPAAGMKQRDPRFFVVEHTVMMLLALTLAHVGGVRSRRAAEPKAAYGAALKWYAASLIAILAGIPWWRPMFQP